MKGVGSEDCDSPNVDVGRFKRLRKGSKLQVSTVVPRGDLDESNLLDKKVYPFLEMPVK